MQDMAEATGKAASVASTYGVKVDQLSALIGTMQATTQQGGDAVGTALRNILMNVENTKTKTIVDTFDQIGVAQTQMVNGVKKSRSAIDILRDLHSVWQDLATDDPMRNTILNTLGGKRSANQLAALMNNWDQYEKMLAQYSQGGGSAMREAEKSANNWQGSLNRLSNTFTGLVQNFANSKGITNAINMLNNVLKVIDQITSKVGALGSLGGLMGFISGARGQSPFASAIMSALGGNGSGRGILTGLFRQIAPTELFKKTKDSIDSATQSTGKFAEGMKKGATAAKETATATGEMQKNVENSSNATSDMGEKVSQGVGASLQSLASSLISGVISAGVNMLVGMALQAVFTAVDNKIHESEYAAEKAATSYATAQESQANLEDTESQLKDVNDQISAIQSKGTLTLVDKAQLQDLEETKTKLEAIRTQQELQRNADAKQASSDALDAWNKGYGKYADYFTGKTSAASKYMAEIRAEALQQDQAGLAYNPYYSGNSVPYYGMTGEGQDKNNIADLITRNSNNVKELTRLQNDIKTNRHLTESDLKDETDSITQYQEAITNNQSALSDAASSIHDSMSQITLASQLTGVSLTTDQQKALDQMQSMYNAIGNSYKETDKATYDTWLQGRIADILSSGKGIKTTISDIESFQDEMGDAGISVDDFKSKFGDLAPQIESISDTALQDYVDMLNASYTSAQEAGDSLEQLADDFNNFNTSAQGAYNALDKVNAAMVESMASGGVSAKWDNETQSLTGGVKDIIEAFQGLDSYDPSKLFEKTARGIHLNGTELRKLQDENADRWRKTFTDQLVDYNEQLEAAKQKLAEYKAANKDTTDIESTISGLENQISNVQLLAAQWDGATSAYQRYLDAQKGGEEGDLYDNITSTVMKRGDELYQAGLVGTNEFRAIASLYSYEDLSPDASVQEVTAAYEKGLPIVQKYFTENSDGAKAFIDQMVQLGDATKDENGNYKLLGNNTRDIAKQFGVSVDLVEAALGKLNDYGITIDFGSVNQDVQTLIDNVNNLDAQLAEKHLSVDIDINTDNVGGEIVTAKDKIAQLKEQLNSGELSEDAKINVQLEIQDAEAKLQVLLSRLPKEELIELGLDPDTQTYDEMVQKIENGEVDMNILANTDKAEQQIDNLKRKASQPISVTAGTPTSETNFITGTNRFNSNSSSQAGGTVATSAPKTTTTTSSSNVAVQVDTTQAKSAISQVETQLNKLANKTINVSAKTTGTGLIGDMKRRIDSLKSKSVTASAKVAGTSAVNGLKGAINQLASKNVSVYATVSGTAAVNALKSAIAGVHSKSVTVTSVTNNYTNNYTSSGEKRKVNGTARAYGSALVQGNWGLRQSGRALVGEVGEEGIVHGNKFYTVGSRGAEFVNLSKGDIVFNHKQTEALLKYGYVTGRGSVVGGSLATGTATALYEGTSEGGGGAFYTPKPELFINPSKSSKSSKSSGGSKKSSGSSKSSGGSKKSSGSSKSSSSKKSSTDDKSQDFDWIEVVIDNIEKAIKKLDNTVQATYKTIQERNSATRDEMSKTADEIDIQQQAYDKYMEKANSYGLSQDWIDKIVNGTMDIDTVTDETTQTAIKNYQTWYDKAKATQEKIDDLRESLVKLYLTQYSNTKTAHEDIIDNLQAQIDLRQANIDRAKEEGHIIGDVYYPKMIEMANSKIQKLSDERQDLLTAMADAVTNGKVQVGSHEWYQMQADIDNLTKSMEQAQQAAAEYANALQQIKWDRFDEQMNMVGDIADELEFLGKTLDKWDNYTDTGAITETGLTKLGIAAMKYNVYMQKSVEYGEQLKEINKQLAADPTNTTLVDRKKELVNVQRESIKAGYEERSTMKSLVKEGIEKQIDAMKDLISEYGKMLDANKDAYDYQRKMEDKVKALNKLQKQYAAGAGDTSEEGRAKQQKLGEQIDEAQQDIADTEEDRRISEIKEMLSQLEEDYTNVLNARLDNMDALVSQVIDTVNATSGTIAETITAKAQDLGVELSTGLSTSLSGLQDAVGIKIDATTGAVNTVNATGQAAGMTITSALNLGASNVVSGSNAAVSNFSNGNFNNKMASILQGIGFIEQQYQKQIDEAKAKEQAEQAKKQAALAAQQKVAQQKANTNKAKTPIPAKTTTSNKTDKDNYGVALAIINGNYGWGNDPFRSGALKNRGYDAAKVQSIVNKLMREGKVNNGSWQGAYYGLKLSDLSKYHYASGTTGIGSDRFARLNEYGGEAVLRKKDNSILTYLPKGSGVMTAGQVSNMWNFARDPSSYLDGIFNGKLNGNSGGAGEMQINTDAKVEFNLPNVKDYADFMREAQKDPKFAQLIQQISVGSLHGANSLKKNQISFK